MISVGNNKAVICKGDFHPAQFYKGDKKITGYSLEEFEGTDGVTLENCYNDKVYNAYVHGKNLLDVQKYYGKYANDNGGISIPKSAILYELSYNCEKITGVFKENTQYTFSCKYNIAETTTTVLTQQIRYTDGTRSNLYLGYGYRMGEGVASHTSTKGKTVASFSFTYGTTSKVFEGELTEMQIEEGDTATEYEPPCRNATITARGKNILDISNTTVRAGYYNDTTGSLNTSNANFTAIYPIKVEPNTTYTITSNLPLYTVWFSTSGSVSSTGAIHRVFKKTFTTTEDCNYIRVSLRGALSDFEWAMLELGEGDGIYEPYIEPQTIPFENGNLAAEIPTFKGTTVIEVESDIPATTSGKYKKVEA